MDLSLTHVSAAVCDTIKLARTKMQIGRFASQNANQILCVLLVYDTTKIFTSNFVKISLFILFLFYSILTRIRRLSLSCEISAIL